MALIHEPEVQETAQTQENIQGQTVDQQSVYTQSKNARGAVETNNVINQRAFENVPLPGSGLGVQGTPYAPHTVLGTGTYNHGLSGLAAFKAANANVMTVDMGSARMTAFLEYFRTTYEEFTKNNDSAIKLEFLPLPQNQLDLPYSGIAVCYLVDNKTVSVHTLVIDDMAPPPEPRVLTAESETIEVPITVGDCFDEPYWQTVISQVQHRYKGQVDIIDGGFSVIYNTVDPEDINARARILTDATNAVVGATSLQTVEGNLASGDTLANALRQVGINLSARVDMSPGTVFTAGGLPVHRDVAVRSYVNQMNGGQNSIRRGGRNGGSCYVDVSAMATLEYVLPPEINPYVQLTPQQQAMLPTQRYIPRIVVTNIESEFKVTLPTVLLGLSTVSVLQEGMLWTEPFRPRPNRKKDTLDINDIGAIGYDIPEMTSDGKPGMIDTRSNKFGASEFYQMMTAAVFPTPTYSIDVPEGHSLSYLLTLLEAAANGSPEANRAIVDAANSLTNNLFSNHFSGGEIIRPDDYRVMLGTYVRADDPDNTLRDSREVDYLAMLNLCGDQPDIIKEFEKAQSSGAYPLEKRVALMHGILEEILGPSFKVKGYARRYTFSSAFISALGRATREAKVAPIFQSLPTHQQEQARRRMDYWGWAMVQQQQLAGAYTGNMGSQGFNGHMQMPHQWGHSGAAVYQ